jgi:YD repeat-containing protein
MPEMIEEWAGDTLISKERLHYDKCGRITHRDTYDSNGEMAHTTRTIYDYRGRVIKEVDAEGHVTTYTYDKNNNLIDQHHPSGRISTKCYDSANRNEMELETAATGDIRTTTHRYNEKNQKIATTNPLGYETTYTYDPFGNLTCTTHHDGSTEQATYDLLGNRIIQTDPRGVTTTATYNCLNSPLHIRYPDGNIETYTYYPSGKLKTHTNQEGDTLTYTYDALGRTSTIDHYGLATETLTYIGENLHTHTDIDGVTTTYKYDTVGRKISEKRGHKKTRFTYDTLGRLYQEIRLNGENTLVTAYSYDHLDQVTSESQQDQYGNIIQATYYTYDTQGNRITETTHNATTRHTYDSFNRLIAEEDAEGHLTTIAYDEHYFHPIHGRTLRKITTDPLQYVPSRKRSKIPMDRPSFEKNISSMRTAIASSKNATSTKIPTTFAPCPSPNTMTA